MTAATITLRRCHYDIITPFIFLPADCFAIFYAIATPSLPFIYYAILRWHYIWGFIILFITYHYWLAIIYAITPLRDSAIISLHYCCHCHYILLYHFHYHFRCHFHCHTLKAGYADLLFRCLLSLRLWVLLILLTSLMSRRHFAAIDYDTGWLFLLRLLASFSRFTLSIIFATCHRWYRWAGRCHFSFFADTSSFFTLTTSWCHLRHYCALLRCCYFLRHMLLSLIIAALLAYASPFLLQPLLAPDAIRGHLFISLLPLALFIAISFTYWLRHYFRHYYYLPCRLRRADAFRWYDDT